MPIHPMRTKTYEQCIAEAMLLGYAYDQVYHYYEVVNPKIRGVDVYDADTLKLLSPVERVERRKLFRHENLEEFSKWRYGEIL